ncbi:Serine/threonine-protein phosphatase 6 regulatory ankyrin repeat subunit B [Cytospora mali]|uniref:Serine/threonine-protein phosphatase 6 regulatory ankyrin repeat subunit B n=1 Tax=Cytospora mali TaxID=578113 RepID=A0A194W2K0_CYTMA|nr:Serine/threonine-protein phosphatase 6 regulatory ankyrin repeat subunit B [Valsa mali]
MLTTVQEYQPFAVLVFIFLSIRLDRASFQNFALVAVGALAAWSVSPANLPWGQAICSFLLALTIAMSPLAPVLVRTFKRLLPKTFQEPEFAMPVRTLTNPDPINVLWDPPGANVDIVAVHGLGCSVETTWMHKRSKQLWLKDFLHLDFPKARIMTFRHNSSWDSNAPVKDLSDYGRQFLGALEGRRTAAEASERPLILVGHSFGGLIIEQALVLARGPAADDDTRAQHESLANSFAGAIFLGTPHAGSSYTLLGKLYCLFHYWEGANPFLLRYMDPGSMERVKLEDDFLKYYRNLSFDFYETKPNIILGIQFQMIVTPIAGTRPGQESHPLDTDHFSLNKYRSRDDASYIAVRDRMSQMLRSWNERVEAKRDSFDANELELLKSLEPYCFTTTSESRQRNLTPGTCQWIVSEREFMKWSPESNVLWILGNPGSGKTYIAQWLCEHLRKTPTNNIIYFFFDAKNEDAKDLCSLKRFYQTVLHQLLEGIRRTRPEKKAQYFRIARQKILREGPGEGSYISALQEVLSISEPSYLVVDALDECKDEEASTLKKWLAKIQAFPNLQIVITGRPTQKLRPVYDDSLCIQLQLSTVVGKLDKDIERYILSRIQNEDSVFPAEMSRVVDILKSRSSGMILYARLMLDILQNKVGTEDDLLEEMEKLPKTLTTLYADRLKNIPDKKFARRILEWLVICRRPFTVDGLRGVDIIDRAIWPTERFDLDKAKPPKDLGKNSCGRDLFSTYRLADLLPLIEILEDKTVRLVHATVSQFLLGEEVEEDGVQCPDAFRVRLADSHKHITITCVAYLRWNLNADNRTILRGVLDNEDLHEYAVLEWPDHCKKSEAQIMDKERERTVIMAFFGRDDVFQAWLTARVELDSLFRARFGLFGRHFVLPQPLHVAVFFNIWRFGRTLLTDTNINARDATGSTALHIAAGQGYPEIVQELLEQGARMDIADHSGAYPLHSAVRRGNHETLAQLADTDQANINVPDKYKFTPMHMACQLGWTQCVAILLQHHASVSNDSRAMETPIGLAIENGHIEVVHALLQHDRSLVEHCGKPLVQAARRGSSEMVKFLCEFGVHMSYTDLLGQTALHKACISGRADLVDYLLDKGAIHVDHKDNSQRTGLYFAAERGFLDVVDCLLRHGADENSLDRREQTVLFKPAGNGHIKVVDRLLRAGTDATRLDLWKRPPLQFAAMKGHVEIVRMLLEKTNTKQNLPGHMGRTVLHHAAEYLREGQEDVIDLLFQHGAQPDVRDEDGDTALHTAVRREGTEPRPAQTLLDRLMQHGVPIDVRNKFGNTALYYAVWDQDLTTVKFLLRAGAKPDDLSLHAAVQRGDVSLVKPFLEQTSTQNLAQMDLYGNTPLHIAASKGDSHTVFTLLGAGAPTRCLNIDGETPVRAAERAKHKETASLLRDADPAPEGDLESHMADFKRSQPNIQYNLGRTVLHMAVILGRLDIVQRLLESQDITEIPDQINRTPLHYAVQQTNIDIAQALLMSMADVNVVDAWGKTPLHFAAKADNIDGVRMLLDAKADFIPSHKGRTPLHIAALNSSSETVKVLLAAKVENSLLPKQDYLGKTAIHLAAERGNGDVMEELLKKTQDTAVIDIRDKKGQTALFLASKHGHLDIIVLLIRAGSIVYRTDNARDMAIHLAAERGHLEIVRSLLDELPNQVQLALDKWKENLPNWPLEKDYHEIAFLNALTSVGALVKDPTCSHLRPDASKWATPEHLQQLQRDVVSSLRTWHKSQHSITSTTLIRAVQGGHVDTVKLLLQKIPEMPLQAQPYWFSNALSFAASKGYVEIAQLLITAGSEVNAITDSQETCLHEAAANGHGNMVELLLRNDANPDLARLCDGSTPLHLAAGAGHEAAARALVRTTFINARDDLGRTPLHRACLGGHSDMVDMLVDADADLAARDFERKTPLELVDLLSGKTRAHMKERAAEQALGGR